MRSAMFIRPLIVAAMAAGVCGAYAADRPEPAVMTTSTVATVPDANKPLVQIAILLDTSGSMSGLIDQARAELWSIVNEFIFAEQGGRRPQVQVALYEYGNDGLPAETGWIRQIVPLTTDLDKISEELFALKTNGGQEYCGWVIKEATGKLAWSGSANDLKAIFIAGNEPFTQGPVDYRQSCKAAVAKGIVVNTIHCGGEQQGVDGMWKDGAVIADGRCLNIDQNRQVVHIAAPQDTEIAELGARLNATYIPYGVQGRVAHERQAAQDTNASHASAQAVVQRALAKSSANYLNSGWDLVDGVQAKSVDLSKIKAEDLPANMQTMSPEERAAYVNARANERTELQAKIQQLNEQRDKYVAEQAAKQPQTDTLGTAVKLAVHEQAQKKNFTFKPAESSTDTGASNPQPK
jgi:hypothetical protein